MAVESARQDAGGTFRFPQTPSTGPLRGQVAPRPPQTPSTGPLTRTKLPSRDSVVTA
jgi:hypothetical protein